MKIKEIALENIRGMSSLHWHLPDGKEAAGWHVILGDNGAGKSSFLRAVAIGLIGVERSAQLWVDFSGWLRQQTSTGSITIQVQPEAPDKATGPGGRATHVGYKLLIQLLQIGEEGVATMTMENQRKSGFRGVWRSTTGWFSAGFGPFRRFTGGDREYDKLFYSNPRLAAHLSLFRENVALTEALEWLRQLKFQTFEGKGEGFFTQLQAFINQPDFLPHGTQLEEVSSAGVFFRDANAQRIGIDDLSDGFRSVLSLTFELLRQLQASYGDKLFEEKQGVLRVKVPGVVLIDEIDVHLHPLWQKRIGYWLTTHFPKVQFFVTTHSPLVCQASELGTVFRLPSPGQLDDRGGMVEGAELGRLIYGNVLEAYGTEVFGLVSTQSDSAHQKLDTLAELNQKALTTTLSDKEEITRDELRSILPISDSQAFLDKMLAEL